MNNLEQYRGPYRTSAVDWIEANVVTDEMVDRALDNRHKKISRERIRRSIAIGIRSGSYRPNIAKS